MVDLAHYESLVSQRTASLVYLVCIKQGFTCQEA